MNISPIKVGVFPCGSEVGLEIYRSLVYSRHFELIGLNSVEDSGQTLYKKYYGNLPFYDQSKFIEKLKEVIKKEEIEFLIPTMDSIGLLLKKSERYLECEVVYADLETAEIISRKTSTYNSLSNVINVPRVFTDFQHATSSLPIYSKNDIGYGARGATKISSLRELEFYWHECPKRIFLEYLPGEEFTVDCISDKNFNVLFSGCRIRSKIRLGISVKTKSFYFKELEIWASRISKTLKLQGAWFFQVKYDSTKNFKLLEVASRVSGSMGLYRFMGINFILLDLFQRMNAPIAIQRFVGESVTMNRSLNCNIEFNYEYKYVYVDLDDCLLINNKVNSKLIQFLYNQINKGKTIILITKHAGELESILRMYRIKQIFDKIIHIRNNKPKYEYIKEFPSILIDDSFNERFEVYKKHKIPTFASDSISMILDVYD